MGGVLRSRREDPAVRITTARSGREADLARRQRRYLISMGIRVACFVGAIVAGPGWLRWVLVTGAVLLPYIAVVIANATDQRHEVFHPEAPDYVDRQLGPGK